MELSNYVGQKKAWTCMQKGFQKYNHILKFQSGPTKYEPWTKSEKC